MSTNPGKLRHLDETNDTSAALIAELEAGAELVAAGAFTLDVAAARDKLSSYRLADPQTFVLLLVEAAHLFAGCESIEVTSTYLELRMILHGVEMSDEELRGILDAAGTSSEGLDAEAAARLQGRQALALAIVAVGQLELGEARLRSSAADVQVELGEGGAIAFTQDRTRGGPALSLTVHEGLSFARQGTALEHRRELLRARARYARVALSLDGERISEGFALAELARPFALRGPKGELRAVFGWSPARAKGTLLLVANGVLLEKLLDDELPANFVALVEVSDLPRDLGMTKLLRQEAYLTRVNEVRAAAASLPNPNWPAPIHVEVPSGTPIIHGLMALLGVFFLIVGSLFIASAAVTSSLGIMLFGLMVGASSWVGINPLRRDIQLYLRRTRGRLAVATIKAVHALNKGAVPHNIRVECVVHLLGQEPYPARFDTNVSGQERRLVPGAHVHVRVDRRHGDRVCLALASAAPMKQLGA